MRRRECTRVAGAAAGGEPTADRRPVDGVALPGEAPEPVTGAHEDRGTVDRWTDAWTRRVAGD